MTAGKCASKENQFACDTARDLNPKKGTDTKNKKIVDTLLSFGRQC
jgi:hypothetical protein